jgi:hypothetical protein
LDLVADFFATGLSFVLAGLMRVVRTLDG